jgi:catechol 2,3-dioxygenase-like lactoylglutathione lyase family enzyme
MPQPANGPELYHTGLVVPDVREAAERYRDLLGLRFATFRESTMNVVVDGAPRQAELLVTYSIDGPPYLELIEERSGGVWAADALGLNHIGFWAPDFLEAARRLTESGLPARVHDDGGDGQPTRFTYHPGDGGVWVELVAPAFHTQLEQWIEASVREAAPSR